MISVRTIAAVATGRRRPKVGHNNDHLLQRLAPEQVAIWRRSRGAPKWANKTTICYDDQRPNKWRFGDGPGRSKVGHKNDHLLRCLAPQQSGESATGQRCPEAGHKNDHLLRRLAPQQSGELATGRRCPKLGHKNDHLLRGLAPQQSGELATGRRCPKVGHKNDHLLRCLAPEKVAS